MLLALKKVNGKLHAISDAPLNDDERLFCSQFGKFVPNGYEFTTYELINKIKMITNDKDYLSLLDRVTREYRGQL